MLLSSRRSEKVSKNKSFMEEKYGLTGTPFKARTASDLELKTWVNREKELEQWNKVLDDAIKTPATNFLVFVIGDYGMGKTLSLLRIGEEAANKKLFEIYLNLISEQRPKNPGLDFILRIMKEINFKDIKTTKQEIALLKGILPEVGKVFEKILFGKDEEKDLATTFLKGEIKPTQTQLKTLQVLRKIDDVDIAKEYLIGIFYLLKTSGFSTLVVAADEFEYLFSLVPKPSQAIYLALLRGLCDLQIEVPQQIRNKVANMALFIAISEDGIRRLTELENVERSTGGPIRPLMRRVSAKVSLGALAKKYVRMLIEIRLSLNRVKGMYEKKPLIPFSEDFVDYVYKLTAGRPSDIIERCDHVLDEGLNQRVPTLTMGFAKEVFKERGFTY